MAKKGKTKISKVKRNNQTTNKMKKQGKLKLQRHRTKVQKQNQPVQPEVQYSSDSDAASADEWTDMLDDEEQKYIMSRLAKQPQLLSNVPEEDPETKLNSKRKRSKPNKGSKPKTTTASDSGADSDLSDSDVEEKYEKEMAERPSKRLRLLLPIKTKQGLEERTEEVEDEKEESDNDKESEIEMEDEEPVASDSDSGMEGTGEEGEAGDNEVVTAVELLAARRDKLKHEKLRIGALCSSLLEEPEKKIKNLFPILYLMEERLKDGALNLHSIRKLATLSVYEVFKDILPDYKIRHQDYSNVKLKKDTLALFKYEKELLEFYKRYLQRLEKAAGVLRRKKGDTRKLDEPSASLALVSLQCMCGMLVARPQFNFATNIAQSVVPFLDCREARAADAVSDACEQVFANDNKGEITLDVVRLINQLAKRRGERLNPKALECLLSLKIRDVDLDAEAELKNKRKQDEKHKKRIVNLSKKEKKRAKKLKEVERELVETEAREDEAARRKLVSEVARTTFHVYFRLLKAAPKAALLAAALQGIAKFTHIINVEYYSDLVRILGSLVQHEGLGPRERLQCVRCVLAVQAGAGDALNVDPSTFHAYLYAHMLAVHAGRTQVDLRTVLEAVSQMTMRARRVSPAVLQAVAKRLATLATQVHHNGAMASMAIIGQLAQQSKAVAVMMEVEGEASGSGRFDPTLASPSHCNAHATALFELAALARHYHPTCALAAKALRSGPGTALPDTRKLSPIQILETYDGSQMALKPAITPPKAKAKAEAKGRAAHAHVWAQPSLQHYCEALERAVPMDITIISNKR